jgi:general secretion pathway protein E
VIEAREIAQARAAAGSRRVVDVLEEKLALEPDVFAERLAATFRLAVLRMEELRRLEPAFDLVPLSECSRKGCVLLRAAGGNEGGELVLATDDPFSAEQAAWAAERIRAPFVWRLVHRGDLVAYLASHEETLRALDKQSLYETTRQQLSLDSLGFEEHDIRALRRLSHEPHGMLLVTGPTGSGKTTTLYAAITEINKGQDKIVTIEDPVEYQLPGVLQIPVNEKKGLTFARGLRSILRHDPDRIMVGEIRDPETANIAVQSALTGHLVFTTVHANNVFDVIGRFMHMNVDLYGFVSALNAILAQRLVRLVCAHCAEDEIPNKEMLQESGLAGMDLSSWKFRMGKGCRECRGAGYRGRKAIAELLILNDEMRELITGRAPIRTLKDAAAKNGTRFLRDAALDAVRRGQTTLEEINRVTFVA